MSFRIYRDDELIAEIADDREYVDTVTENTTYSYRVEHWANDQTGSRETVVVDSGVYQPTVHEFWSIRPDLSWADMPTSDPDNGSLDLVETKTVDGLLYEINDTFTDATQITPWNGNIQEETPGPYWSNIPSKSVMDMRIYRYVADFSWSNYTKKAKLDHIWEFVYFKNNQIDDSRYAFYFYCQERAGGIVDLDVSNLTSLQGLFSHCFRLNEENFLFGWDVGHITDFSGCFHEAYWIGYEVMGIENWDFSNAITTRGMFAYMDYCEDFMDAWDFSNVQDASYMFYCADGFYNGFSVSTVPWDWSSCKDMSFMFAANWDYYWYGVTSQYAWQLTRDWNVSSVTNMDSMFAFGNGDWYYDDDCGKFDPGWNLTTIEYWNTKNVTNMDQMFYQSGGHKYWLADWCVSKIPSRPPRFLESSYMEGSCPEKEPKWGQATPRCSQ